MLLIVHQKLQMNSCHYKADIFEQMNSHKNSNFTKMHKTLNKCCFLINPGEVVTPSHIY